MENQKYCKNLGNAKVGDTVVFRGYYYGYKFATVFKVTPSRIYAGRNGEWFHKKNDLHQKPFGPRTAVTIYPATDVNIAKAKHDMAKLDMKAKAEKLNSYDFRTLSETGISAVIEIIEGGRITDPFQ